MKKSYHLLGKIWDRGEAPGLQMENFRFAEKPLRDYREKRDLFDAQEFVRKVRLSEVMTIETEEKARDLKVKLRKIDVVYVELDNFPKSGNLALERLVMKRNRQMIHFLKT